MNQSVTHNMGPVERGIRFIAGVALLGLYGALPSPWRYLTLVGIVLIATAWMGWCPLYSWLRRPGGHPRGGG